MRCEAPNGVFDKFAGTLALSEDAAPLPVDIDAVLLRGCVVRGVDLAYCLVVYTGADTKVRVKQRPRQGKRAGVERLINRYIVALVGLVLLACAAGTVASGYWVAANKVNATYLALEVQFAVRARAAAERCLSCVWLMGGPPSPAGFQLG